MLEVQIENIIPVTEARDKFNQLVDAVDGTDELFVLTKNGKPIAILVGVHHLEKLTGEDHEQLFGVSGNDSNQPAEKEEPEIPAMPMGGLEQSVDPMPTMPEVTADLSAAEEAPLAPQPLSAPAATSAAMEVEDMMPTQIANPTQVAPAAQEPVAQPQDQADYPTEIPQAEAAEVAPNITSNPQPEAVPADFPPVLDNAVEAPIVSPSVPPTQEELPPVNQTSNFFAGNAPTPPSLNENPQPQAAAPNAGIPASSANPFGDTDDEQLEDPSGGSI